MVKGGIGYLYMAIFDILDVQRAKMIKIEFLVIRMVIFGILVTLTILALQMTKIPKMAIQMTKNPIFTILALSNDQNTENNQKNC